MKTVHRIRRGRSVKHQKLLKWNIYSVADEKMIVFYDGEGTKIERIQTLVESNLSHLYTNTKGQYNKTTSSYNMIGGRMNT